MPKTVVVLGARNLGGAIVDYFVGLGWNAAAIARSEETLERVRTRGAIGLAADAAEPGALTEALATARRELGSVDAVVNAVSASRPPTSGPFGGGPLAEADLEAFRGWTAAVAEQAFVFLSVGAAALRQSGRRSADPDHRGLLAPRDAGQGAVGGRCLCHPAPGSRPPRRSCGARASTSRCSPSTRRSSRRSTAAYTRDAPRDALADMDGVAAAVGYLVGQDAQGLTHELVITPSGERWVP